MAFDDKAVRTFGSKSSVEAFDVEFSKKKAELYKDEIQECAGTPDMDDLPDDCFDQYLNAEVLLPKWGQYDDW